MDALNVLRDAAGGLSEEQRQQVADKLYQHIITTANRFLHNCKHFKIEVLQNHNPTYEELAELIDDICKLVVYLVNDIDPLTSQKAYEYCALMKKMSVCITNNDEAGLAELILELDRRPML